MDSASSEQNGNQRWKAFALSAVLGFLVWFLSLPFTGKPEPWDSETPYYPVALILAGVLAGVLRAKPLWLLPLGIFAGQAFAVFVRGFTHPIAGANMFFPIGAVMMAAYSLLSLVGSVPVAWALARFGNSRRRTDNEQ